MSQNRGILQIVNNELEIIEGLEIQGIENKMNWRYIKTGKEKIKLDDQIFERGKHESYIMIPIIFNVKKIEEYEKYTNYLNKLEEMNIKISEEVLLKYYGVYSTYTNIYMIYENFGMNYRNFIRQKFARNNQGITQIFQEADKMIHILKQIFSIYEKFESFNVQRSFPIDLDFFYIDEEGNIKLLFLGEVYVNERDYIDLRGVEQIYRSFLKDCNENTTDTKQIFNKKLLIFFVDLLIFTFTGEERVSSSEQLQKIPKIFRNFVNYYFMNGKNIQATSEHFLQYLKIIFSNIEEKDNKIFKIKQRLKLNNLKTKIIDPNFFFDGCYTQFGRSHQSLEESHEIVIDLSYLKDNTYLINFTIHKQLTEEVRVEQQRDGVNNIESKISKNRRESEFSDINAIKDEFIPKVELKEDDSKSKMKLLDFMYRHFPQKHNSFIINEEDSSDEEVHPTVYVKVKESDLFNSTIEKTKLPSPLKFSYDFLNKKSMRKENLKENKLTKFKEKIFSTQKMKSEDTPFKKQTNKIWEGENNISNEELKEWINEVECIWPKKLISYSEDKCLSFLNLCNSDLFKSKFYIESRDEIFLKFFFNHQADFFKSVL